MKLVNRETEFYKFDLDVSVQQEETLEVIVPDSMPDIGRILFTGAVPLMRSKEAADGRVSVSGMVNFCVLYLADDSARIRRLEAVLPFTAVVEDAAISGGSKIVANTVTAAADARAVNPRKLVLRADLLTKIRVLREDCLRLTCPEESGGEAELLLDKKTLTLAADVREKTFVLTEEFSVPAGEAEPDEILKSTVTLSAGECRPVGNKLIFRGEAKVELYYSAGEENPLCRTEYTADFSQVVEMGRNEQALDYDLCLMLTGAYFEPADGENDPKRLAMELHVVAQVVAWEEREITYIADAYCPNRALEITVQNCDPCCRGPRSRTAQTGNAALQTPTVPRKVLAWELRPGKCRLEEEKLLLNASAAVIYLGEDGNLAGVTGRFELSCPCREEGTIRAVKFGEGAVSISQTGLDLRLPFEAEFEDSCTEAFSAVTEIKEAEEGEKDQSALPSLVIVRPGKESLWNLAKRYSSTRDLIRSCNGFDEMPEDGLILIPKAR